MEHASELYRDWLEAFAAMPMSFHHHQCEYMSGKAIEDGDTLSWSPERQREAVQA